MPYHCLSNLYLAARRLLSAVPYLTTRRRKAYWDMGQRHKRYLKEHKRTTYATLLTSGNLNSYLADIDQQAEEMFSQLVNQITEHKGMTEALKVQDQMAWVQRMNNIRSRATEIINNDLICN